MRTAHLAFWSLDFLMCKIGGSGLRNSFEQRILSRGGNQTDSNKAESGLAGP